MHIEDPFSRMISRPRILILTSLAMIAFAGNSLLCHVNLAGGARAQNVYWATFAAADLGTTSQFKGTLLSQTSITMKTGARINGKLSAGTAINLDTNTVGP